jgi:outer membrane protein assembly factor BamB
LCWLSAWFSSSSAVAGDWAQFRGPGGRGISEETGLPLTWGTDKNIRWRVELPGPGNNGSPIVSKDAVFVVVAKNEGSQRSLHCYDRNSGDLRWVRTVDFDGEEPTHGTSHYGGSTPSADGERVVVWHSSAGMHCYDYDGNPLWSQDLGAFIHIWGYGASPVIHKDLVINNCGPGARQRLVALDKGTGDIIWQVEEPGGTSGRVKPWIGSWSTPMIALVEGRDQILVSYPHHVNAYDPRSGKILWQRGGLGRLVYTSCVIGDGQAVAMSGFHGPAIGFRLGGSENAGEQGPLWRVEKNLQRIGSGVILDGNMFMANERGTVRCFEVATGNVLWEDRLPTKSRLWASLIAADGRLYVTTQAGETIVFAVDPKKFEVLAVNEIGEKSNSTLAVSSGQLFLQTWRGLYCIEQR